MGPEDSENFSWWGKSIWGFRFELVDGVWVGEIGILAVSEDKVVQVGFVGDAGEFEAHNTKATSAAGLLQSGEIDVEQVWMQEKAVKFVEVVNARTRDDLGRQHHVFGIGWVDGLFHLNDVLRLDGHIRLDFQRVFFSLLKELMVGSIELASHFGDKAE